MTRLLAISLSLSLAFAPLLAYDIYRWTDDEGNIHVATSLDDVPEKYRDQIKTITTETTTATPGGEEVPVVKAEVTLEEPGSFEVPYENEGSTRRVIIPVKFNDRVTAPMALDTGAPGMVISVELAAKLGIFSKDSGVLLSTAGGIGGSQAAIVSILDSISVEDARDEFVPVTITRSISDKFEGLVGMNLLANYRVSIDSARKVVVFEELPPRAGLRGGHDEEWWRNTFNRFKSSADFWKSLLESQQGRAFETRNLSILEFQARESDRLLRRLELYAASNAVPRHWRQ